MSTEPSWPPISANKENGATHPINWNVAPFQIRSETWFQLGTILKAGEPQPRLTPISALV